MSGIAAPHEPGGDQGRSRDRQRNQNREKQRSLHLGLIRLPPQMAPRHQRQAQRLDAQRRDDKRIPRHTGMQQRKRGNHQQPPGHKDGETQCSHCFPDNLTYPKYKTLISEIEIFIFPLVCLRLQYRGKPDPVPSAPVRPLSRPRCCSFLDQRKTNGG